MSSNNAIENSATGQDNKATNENDKNTNSNNNNNLPSKQVILINVSEVTDGQSSVTGQPKPLNNMRSLNQNSDVELMEEIPFSDSNKNEPGFTSTRSTNHANPSSHHFNPENHAASNNNFVTTQNQNSRHQQVGLGDPYVGGHQQQQQRPTTPYHIVEILLNSRSDILPGVSQTWLRIQL